MPIARARQSALKAEKIVDREMPSARPAMVAAMHLARFEAARSDMMSVRVAKQKGFVDAMYQAENSRIPFAGDPLLVYPDADVWRELTATRRQPEWPEQKSTR